MCSMTELQTHFSQRADGADFAAMLGLVQHKVMDDTFGCDIVALKRTVKIIVRDVLEG